MDHVSFDRALETLQGPIGRAIDGSRSAAFNGGRTPIDVDKVLDKIRLWLIVVLPHLPRPKPRNKQLVELNMDQECASCNYEGSLLKSGGTLTSKLLRVKAWKTGYYTNAQKWCQFAHALVVDVYLSFLRTVFFAIKVSTGPLTNDILQITLKSF